MVAAEVGHLELAYDYFAEAALLDLGDIHHNTRDGSTLPRPPARGAAVAGFGGVRDDVPARSDAPAAGCDHPARVRLPIQGPSDPGLNNAREARYTMVEGDPLEVTHHGSAVTIATDGPVSVRSRRRRSASGEQPRGRAPTRRVPPSESGEEGGIRDEARSGSLQVAPGSPSVRSGDDEDDCARPRDTLPLKSWLATGVLALAAVQLELALWMYGRFPGLGVAGSRPHYVHRAVGFVALLITLPIA